MVSVEAPVHDCDITDMNVSVTFGWNALFLLFLLKMLNPSLRIKFTRGYQYGNLVTVGFGIKSYLIKSDTMKRLCQSLADAK